jgi:hypothetical protein
MTGISPGKPNKGALAAASDSEAAGEMAAAPDGRALALLRLEEFFPQPHKSSAGRNNKTAAENFITLFSAITAPG